LNPSRTVTVQVVGDTVAEPDERFFLDLVSARPEVLLSPASAVGEIVNDDFFADLRLRMTRLPGVVTAGLTLTYAIEVDNTSSLLAVPQANLVFSPPTQLQGVIWTCTASPGSSCSAPSGNGALPSVALGIGGSATLQVTATVVAGTAMGTRFSSSATVTPVAPFADPVPGNNSASVQSQVGVDGIFADGFE
jgi:hypothetical protein